MTLARTSIDNADLVELTRLRRLYHLDLSETRIDAQGLVWLRAFRELRSLKLDGLPLTDADLPMLQSLPLTDIALNQVKITDDGIKHLASMRLASVWLNKTSVTDAGLKLLVHRRLLILEVEGTAATDSLLVALNGCDALVRLNVARTKISDSAVEQFAKDHPACTIVYSDGGAVKTIEGRAGGPGVGGGVFSIPAEALP